MCIPSEGRDTMGSEADGGRWMLCREGGDEGMVGSLGWVFVGG